MASQAVLMIGRTGEARDAALNAHRQAVDWLESAAGKLETAKNALLAKTGTYTEAWINDQLRNEYTDTADTFTSKMASAFDKLDAYSQTALEEAGRLREKSESQLDFARLGFLTTEYQAALATAQNGAGAKVMELRESAQGDVHKLRALRAAALPILQAEAQRFNDNARGYQAMNAKNLLLADAESESSDDVKMLEAVPAKVREWQGELIPLATRTVGQIAAVGLAKYGRADQSWVHPFSTRFYGSAPNSSGGVTQHDQAEYGQAVAA